MSKILAPSYQRSQLSSVSPRVWRPQVPKSPFTEYLGRKKLTIGELNPYDLEIWMNILTGSAPAQVVSDPLDRVTQVAYGMQQASATTYKIKAASSFYNTDAEYLERFGSKINHEANLDDLRMQGLAALTGILTVNGGSGYQGNFMDGILNSPKTTNYIFPDDSAGNSDLESYLPTDLYYTLMGIIVSMESNLQNTGLVRTIAMSPRMYNAMSQTKMLNMQELGGFAGEAQSVINAMQKIRRDRKNDPSFDIAEGNTEFEFRIDPKLEGIANNGSADAILFLIPESKEEQTIKVYDALVEDQNLFGEQDGVQDNIIQWLANNDMMQMKSPTNSGAGQLTEEWNTATASLIMAEGFVTKTYFNFQAV